MSKKQSKRLFALLVAFALFTTGIAVSPTQVAAASKTKVGDAYYKVTSAKKLTAEYVTPISKTCTSATIPKTVKIGKKTYKVTGIAENAFKGCSKLTKVTIGKNVGKIGKKAFYGCKNLKAIKINTTKLTKKSVGSKAFAKINAKVIITVPQSKRTEYNEILRASGIPSTYSLEWEVVEEEKEEVRDDGVAVKNYTLGQPLPEPKTKSFAIGDCLQSSIFNDESSLKKKYFPNMDIKFTAGVKMPVEIYGNWTKEKVKDDFYFECGPCGRYFKTDAMFALHVPLTECKGGNYLTHSSSEDMVFNEWVFTPDSSPCKVVYQFTLPDGLSYKEGSVKVRAWKAQDIPDSAYQVEYTGNRLIVTIEDIKSLPYYFPVDKKEYDKNPFDYDTMQEKEGLPVGSIRPINVLFSTNMNDSISNVNVVSGNIVYSYKGNEKTIELGNRTVYCTGQPVFQTGE